MALTRAPRPLHCQNQIPVYQRAEKIKYIQTPYSNVAENVLSPSRNIKRVLTVPIFEFRVPKDETEINVR
ncbi:hypothetical protein BC938DRAFT_475964 [Jimgerdemannia flammicorona]|uniref:Uncharacterized protein n=1 Tax=Jimgerdemannia flammicorona TaxID=994334 RepID=A0A433PLX3_9FUNG|nr:hypothetical protein BC938DRAFT_475964 [Jimgerdemannia flammicorona]